MNRILLTPEDQGGNGGGNANPDPNPVDQGTATPAAPQGDGRFVPDSEYQALQRAREQAAGSQRTWQQLQALGIKDEASLMERLKTAQQFEKINSDPRLKGAFEAMISEPEQPQSDDAPLSRSEAQKLMMESLTQFHTQQQKAERDRMLKQAQEMEGRLLSESLKDERLQKVFGQHSFEDALSGKAGAVPRLIATAIDDRLYRASQQNGGMPITDSSVLNAEIEAVWKDLGELRASTILSASRPAPGDNGTIGTPVHSDEPSRSPDADTNEAAKGDFLARLKSLTGQGQPLSQT